MSTPSLGAEFRAHLAVQREKNPALPALHFCACGNTVHSGQLKRFGKCAPCALAERVATLRPGDVDKIREAMGVSPSSRRQTWGTRNRYRANSVSDVEAMSRLVAAGFAVQGETLEDGAIMFHATRAGAKLAGFDYAAMRRAFGE